MTREEFKNIVKAIRGAYMNTAINSQQVFDEWYTLLRDMDYREVSVNLENHIKSSKFPPTIAELRGKEKYPFGRKYDYEKLELALLGVSPVDFEEVRLLEGKRD